MPLTAHQRFHLEAILLDAKTSPDRGRIEREAKALLDETEPWPDSRLAPFQIHDWIKKPTQRLFLIDQGW